ncbi:MAG: hypothetical protein ACTTJW_04945 [Sphaerochaeta sp.]
MRKYKVFFFCLLFIVILVSCSENPGTTTMKLILSSVPEKGSRTLLPGDSTLIEVSKYTVSGKGPNGKTFTRNADSNVIEIEGLTLGEWTVTAKGLNREGTELVSGTNTFNLTSEPAHQTIVLGTIIGSGSFSFVLDWSLCDVAAPSIDVFLTGPSADAAEMPLAVTVNTDTKTATVSETLPSGSYRVRVTLKDGSQQVAGLVEAVRISNGTKTSGTHFFRFNELGPATMLYFKDASGTPIKGTLTASGNPSEFLSGKNYTYVFAFSEPDKVETEGLSIDWYYDGNLVKSISLLDKTGSSFTSCVNTGVHRVDAVVYNKLLGSTGSAAYTFTVVPDGVPGEMTLLNADAGSAVPNMDSDTIVTALPGQMFLVTTPNSAKMHICKVSSGAFQILKTYDGSNFAWLSNVKHVFSDPAMEFIVATDTSGGHENFTCLRFSEDAKTLADFGLRYENGISSLKREFVDLTTAAFAPPFGFIYIADSQVYDFFLKRDGELMKLGGQTGKRLAPYFKVQDMALSPDCQYFVRTGYSSNSFLSATSYSSGLVSALCESEPCSGTISRIRFVNNQTVVVTNPTEITTFKAVLKGSFTKYKTFPISANALESDGANYFYIADNSRRLVSFGVSGYEIEQLGFTTLENAISRICLNGRYLAAFTSNNKIALFEVIE